MNGHLLDTPLEPGSPEWLETISASQIAAIAGLSPWQTPHALWHQKRGTIGREPMTDAQKRGHELEPLIAAHYAEREGITLLSTGTWAHDARPWQTANPDRLHFPRGMDADPVLVEIKSVHPGGMRNWADGPPDYYIAQVQWQLDTLGVDKAVLVWSSGNELFDRRPKSVPIERDRQAADWLLHQARVFLDSLAFDDEPPADFARECDRKVLRHKHSEITDAGVEVPDDLARPFVTALADAKAADEAKAVASANLAAYLGDGRKATWQGVTLGTRRAGRGDNPPTFSAAPRLAERTAHLTQESAA